jgi:DNA-binding IclR family transcriptional regulator
MYFAMVNSNGEIREHSAARVQGMLLPTIHARCMPVFDATGALALALIALGQKALSISAGAAKSTWHCATARNGCPMNL